MHGGAALLFARLDDGPVHVHAVHPLPAERGQQSWMDVQDAAREASDDSRRHELQVSRQQNHVDGVGLEERQHLTPHVTELTPLGRHDGGGHTGPLGPLEGARGRAIAEEQNDLPAAVGALVIEESLEVGAATGGEDGRPEAHASSPP